jgi:hypothetical protein
MDTQNSRWARLEANVNPPRTVKPYKKNNPKWFAHFGRLPCDQNNSVIEVIMTPPLASFILRSIDDRRTVCLFRQLFGAQIAVPR